MINNSVANQGPQCKTHGIQNDFSFLMAPCRQRETALYFKDFIFCGGFVKFSRFGTMADLLAANIYDSIFPVDCRPQLSQPSRLISDNKIKINDSKKSTSGGTDKTGNLDGPGDWTIFSDRRTVPNGRVHAPESENFFQRFLRRGPDATPMRENKCRFDTECSLDVGIILTRSVLKQEKRQTSFHMTIFFFELSSVNKK